MGTLRGKNKMAFKVFNTQNTRISICHDGMQMTSVAYSNKSMLIRQGFLGYNISIVDLGAKKPADKFLLCENYIRKILFTDSSEGLSYFAKLLCKISSSCMGKRCKY